VRANAILAGLMTSTHTFFLIIILLRLVRIIYIVILLRVADDYFSTGLNFETLATLVYQYASDELLEESALEALVIIVAGV
jgi:iron(III) transport system permease protein